MDAFLCISASEFYTWKEQKRDGDERLCGWEWGEGGRERQRQAENMRMELSSGYIWGLCDSWIPFAPYSSRHHVSVSAASVKIEKAADEESNLRQPSAWAALPPKQLGCVCHGRSWKRKGSCELTSILFLSFFSSFAANDPVSPKSCICSMQLKSAAFIPKESALSTSFYDTRFVFGLEFNQFLYKQLGSRGSFTSFSVYNTDR